MSYSDDPEVFIYPLPDELKCPVWYVLVLPSHLFYTTLLNVNLTRGYSFDLFRDPIITRDCAHSVCIYNLHDLELIPIIRLVL